MTQIPLTKGKVALVDDPDAEQVLKHHWYAQNAGAKNRDCWYAATELRGRTILMHRMIMNPPAAKQIDHIDGDGLNNTRGNLRVCTPNQNHWNTKARWGRSAFKGVYESEKHRSLRWCAGIRFMKRTVHLGRFASEIEAACAYDRAAQAYFGDFADTNFPVNDN